MGRLPRQNHGSQIGRSLIRFCSAFYSLLAYFGVRHAQETEWRIQVTEREPDDAADPEFREVVAAARLHSGEPATRRHSPLYEWLWARYTGMARELDPPRTPNWAALAKKFGALGILDGKGQAPRPVTVRQTWAKVKQAKGVVASGVVPRRKGKNPAAGPERLAGQPQPASSAPVHATPAGNNGMLPSGIEPPEEEDSEFKFEFMSAKDWTKVTDKGDE